MEGIKTILERSFDLSDLEIESVEHILYKNLEEYSLSNCGEVAFGDMEEYEFEKLLIAMLAALFIKEGRGSQWKDNIITMPLLEGNIYYTINPSDTIWGPEICIEVVLGDGKYSYERHFTGRRSFGERYYKDISKERSENFHYRKHENSLNFPWREFYRL